MQRKFGAGLLVGSVLVVGVPLMAQTNAFAAASLQFCVSEGAGHLLVSGPATPAAVDTGKLDPTTSTSCYTVAGAGAGYYQAYAGKFLDAPCYRTTDGNLVNPPQRVTTGARCQGKVTDIDVTANSTALAPIQQDRILYYYDGSSAVTVTFHVVDVRYPDCVSRTGPLSPDTNNASTICEPTGSTRS